MGAGVSPRTTGRVGETQPRTKKRQFVTAITAAAMCRCDQSDWGSRGVFTGRHIMSIARTLACMLVTAAAAGAFTPAAYAKAPCSVRSGAAAATSLPPTQVAEAQSEKPRQATDPAKTRQASKQSAKCARRRQAQKGSSVQSSPQAERQLHSVSGGPLQLDLGVRGIPAAKPHGT